jgi:hypothetical protein
MQKAAMMEPAKREGVQNFWEAYTEENVDLVALNHHVSMPVRQQYGGLSLII